MTKNERLNIGIVSFVDSVSVFAVKCEERIRIHYFEVIIGILVLKRLEAVEQVRRRNEYYSANVEHRSSEFGNVDSICF